MNIFVEINRLVNYGIKKQLIGKEDAVYVTNRLLEILSLDSYEDVRVPEEDLGSPNDILENMLDWAWSNGVLEHNGTVYRDLLDTKIMGCFVPFPSQVIQNFKEKYSINPRAATDYFYNFSKATNYIRTERVAKNLSWEVNTDYGNLHITINLSKPEKDPKAIEASKNLVVSSYPKCLLCRENEGYSGRVNHPARQTHRVIPIELLHECWFLQYSPYVYYNEHSIIFRGEHTPMRICGETFSRLLEFVEKVPHYFVGSNADLPIVGGSILAHDHFQGGNYHFPMEGAPITDEISLRSFEGITAGIVKWPMSVVRLRGHNRTSLAKAGEYVLEKWRNYSDREVDLIAYTEDVPHNTITPIARKNGSLFELDLVLRNNRRDDKHPEGIFHPHRNLHHIKKENIGLIEVMGLAILPGRLKKELEGIKKAIILGEYPDSEEMKKHLKWIGELKNKYPGLNQSNIDDILREEVGCKFKLVLEDAGIFKKGEKGRLAFLKFLHSL